MFLKLFEMSILIHFFKKIEIFVNTFFLSIPVNVCQFYAGNLTFIGRFIIFNGNHAIL